MNKLVKTQSLLRTLILTTFMFAGTLILTLTNCENFQNSGETALTISMNSFITNNIAESSSGRAAMPWPPTEVPGMLEQISYELTLSGPGETLNINAKGRDSISTTVIAGLWNVSVKAFYQDNLYATGSNSVDVIAGQNNVCEIKMNKAFSEDDKAITAFIFNSPAATGIINETAKTISVTVPFGTSVTALMPTITHTGASISPESGVAQDFTSPVKYTVTAVDGSKQEYTVTVTVAASDEKAITGFSFPTTPVSTGIIDEAAKTISITVYSADLTGLTPDVTHTGVSYSPIGAQNFTSPVTYTVTAADGTMQDYIVTAIPTYTVTFSVEGAAYTTLTIAPGGYAAKPDTDPTHPTASSTWAANFRGWFTVDDTECETPFDFTGTLITEDITLIADFEYHRIFTNELFG